MKRRGNITAYKNWAPDGVLWTEWTKPVLFADIENIDWSAKVEIPEINWIETVAADTAIILDLPGKTGVAEGMALARMGYRPVPLYNGVNCKSSKPAGAASVSKTFSNNVVASIHTQLVNSQEIAEALFACANEIAALNIEDDAPPVFMLDSNRMKGVTTYGMYDNRWRVFPQDMPSAAFLRQQGIKKIIVRTESIQKDLTHILFRYQEHGIPIRHCGENGQTRVIRIPWFLKGLFYRFGAISGLFRNAAGGFGGVNMLDGSGGGG